MTGISKIGAKIKILREQKGLSQKELGKLIGCPQTTVANWERQAKISPRKELITPIANALNVSEAYLLGIERENLFKIENLGSLINNKLFKEQQNYFEVTEREYKSNRFSIIMKENKYSPLIMKNDYCIFEKSKPEVNDIVLAKIKQKYMLKKWQETIEFIILTDITLEGKDEPIVLKKDIEQGYIGKLVTVKRYLK